MNLTASPLFDNNVSWFLYTTLLVVSTFIVVYLLGKIHLFLNFDFPDKCPKETGACPKL